MSFSTELTPITPHEEYTQRRDAQQQLVGRWSRQEVYLGNGRVVAFLAGVALAWATLGAGLLTPWLILAPALAFVGLVMWHERVTRAGRRAQRTAAFYDRGLARLEDRWAGTGEPGTRFLDENHPYAADLDLFGKASLFELLCTARTRGGEDTLAAWLRGPASSDEIKARQGAITELRPRLDLREDLALLGADLRAVVDPAGLAAWGAAPPILVTRWPRYAAFLLGGLGLAALVGWFALDLGPSPVVAVLMLETLLIFWLRDRVHKVLAPLDRTLRHLALLAGVLERLEQERFTASRLVALRAALDTDGQPPSRRVSQLAHLVDLLDWGRNQFFAPFAILLMWHTHLAFAFEAWRRTAGPAIGRWLDAVGEFEALLALASYSSENPADPFPEIVPDGPQFDGEGLGHPLIPVARCVRNDLRLGDDRRLLLVSGSNMSGKSTLLRTVGVNTVLALAGAPVRATRLRVSPLAVGATLRIQDSLQAGRSRFFAEITRVRQLVDLARGTPPLLFLLDEVLAGTNSHDRRLGAEAVVRSLVEYGAVGLVTTHDLALTHIADRLGLQAANVHFEDHFENGAITFDYQMRPGVVQKSNALALMRAVGLEV